MATYALIHGAGGCVGWYWHLVEAELRLAVTTRWRLICPCEGRRTAGLPEYANTVLDASVIGSMSSS